MVVFFDENLLTLYWIRITYKNVLVKQKIE